MHEFIKRKVAIYYYHNVFLVTLRKRKFEIFTITLIKIYISIFLRRFWKTNPFSVATRDHRKHTTTNAITIAPQLSLSSPKCQVQISNSSTVLTGGDEVISENLFSTIFPELIGYYLNYILILLLSFLETFSLCNANCKMYSTYVYTYNI